MTARKDDDYDLVFRTLRHFPELRASLGELKASKSSLVRPQPAAKSAEESELLVHAAPRTAAYKLRQLKKSSIDEIYPFLSTFRRKWSESRGLAHRFDRPNRLVSSSTVLSADLGFDDDGVDGADGDSQSNASETRLRAGMGAAAPQPMAVPTIETILTKVVQSLTTFDFSGTNAAYTAFREVAEVSNLTFDDFRYCLHNVYGMWLSKKESRLLFQHWTMGSTSLRSGEPDTATLTGTNRVVSWDPAHKKLNGLTLLRILLNLRQDSASIYSARDQQQQVVATDRSEREHQNHIISGNSSIASDHHSYQEAHGSDELLDGNSSVGSYSKQNRSKHKARAPLPLPLTLPTFAKIEAASLLQQQAQEHPLITSPTHSMATARSLYSVSVGGDSVHAAATAGLVVTEEELQQALQSVEAKLKKAAFTFDSQHFMNQSITRSLHTTFESVEFVVLLERIFILKLSAIEAAALSRRFRVIPSQSSPLSASVYSSESSTIIQVRGNDITLTYVDGIAFLKYFFELHAVAWREHHDHNAVLAARQRRLRAKGQSVDYLPKVLGR